MATVCVITGGGSGMGLEVAKLVGAEQKVILVGRTVTKLEGTRETLHELGIDAEIFPADVSDRAAVQKLAEYAASMGTVKTVVHAAGVSPHMTNGEEIFAINSVGTVYMNEEFAKVMGVGGVILNVASMAAHMPAADTVPTHAFQAAFIDTAALQAAGEHMFADVPDEYKTGIAYTVSKKFVVWYTQRMALELGKRGIRVVSISPGTFLTPMGKLKGKQAADIAQAGALGRTGDPVEIARMMVFMVSDAANYLTGTDLLYDGGAVAAQRVIQEQAANGE